MKPRLNLFFGSLVAFAMSQAAHAASGSWNVDANSLWSASGNWSGGTIADDSTSTANFTNNITADRTVSLDSARILNRLVFSDSNTATAGSWLINNNGTAANILTLGGTGPSITVNALGTGKTAEISAVLAGNTERITKAGTGTLVLSGANTYSVGMNVTGGVVIMNNASALVGGSTTASDTTGSSFTINGTSTFRQSDGKITVAGANDSTNTSNGFNGMTLGAGSYGAYELSGGILQINNPWRLNPRRSQLTQTGGNLNVNYTGTGAISNGRQFIIGSGVERGVIYSTAGTTTITTAATLTGAPLIISDTTTSSNENGADLTIADTADWTVSGGAGFVQMTRPNVPGGDSDNETGNLNLNNGGRLTTNGISIGDTGGIGRININGGTLRAGANNTTFLQGLTSARIYSGGATIDAQNYSITIAQNLESPTGNGVATIPVASAGSRYIGAPIVTITGGGGNGATAVANLDAATGTVTGITITNPGSGYTSSPTATLSHGTTSTAATLGTVTTAALTSGGLVKSGTGRLTLTGTNTYSGFTDLAQGSLAVSGNASLPGWDTSGRFSVAPGTTLIVGNGFSNTDVSTMLGTTNFDDGATIGFDTTAADRSYTSALTDTAQGKLGVLKTGTGTLTLSGPSTYTGGTTVTGGVVVMNNASALAGGSTSIADFTINSTSAFRQSAGKITVSAANDSTNGTGGLNGMILGGGSSYGAYELSGGTLEINDPWRMNPRRAKITQTGGNFNVNYTGTGTLANGRQFIIGNGTERGIYLATAGNLTITTSSALNGNILALVIGDTDTTQHTNGSEMTLSGTAEVTLSGGAGSVLMTRSSTKTGFLNLNGGRLTTNSIVNTAVGVLDVTPQSTGGGIGRLSIDGGTLRAQIDTTTFLQGLTSARIYRGGATIDTNGKNITIGQNLEAPTGNGLTSIALTSGGSGYVGAPIVTITGGGGTGATAVANFDAATGTVTGITISSPGSGYTSNPTVTLNHGRSGGSNATLGTITTGALTGGDLNKIGSGTLTLSGSSTYTGNTTVSAGTLSLASTGSQRFFPTTNGVCNKITGAGAANLNGTLHLDLTNANLTVGNSWTLVDVTTPDYALVAITSTPALTFTQSGQLWTAPDGPNTWTFSQISGALTLTANAGFASWIATPAFGLAPADQDPTDDPDNDGISNVMEYVLNGNPGTSSTNILPAADNGDPTDLIFTFTRREESAADTTQIFQYGTDLSDWTDINITGTPGAEVTLGTPVDGLQLVTVKVPKSAATSRKLFGRLQVTKP